MLFWPFFASRLGIPRASTKPTFKQALIAYLKASQVAALVSRIEPVRPGQKATYPSLTTRVIDRSPGYSLDGDSGYADATVELVARSSVYGEADAIVIAVARLFGGFQGDMAGVSVLWALVQPDADDSDPAEDGSNHDTYTDTVSINFRYRTR